MLSLLTHANPSIMPTCLQIKLILQKEASLEMPSILMVTTIEIREGWIGKRELPIVSTPALTALLQDSKLLPTV